MPCCKTTRSTPRSCSAADSSSKCWRLRPSRSSLVTTSVSPARSSASARSSSGRDLLLSGGVLDEQPLAAVGLQDVRLPVGVLLASRYPRVPDSHCVLRWLPATDCGRNGGARLIGADASRGTSDTPVSLSTGK